MATDLQYPMPSDSLGENFVGPVNTATGLPAALKGMNPVTISGSPTSMAALTLVTHEDVGSTNTSFTNSNGGTVNGGTTNAGSDTSMTFATLINHFVLQNNSAANLYYNLDAAASTSSFVLAPNTLIAWDWPVTVLHVYTAAAINVNGASGLVLIGRV